MSDQYIDHGSPIAIDSNSSRNSEYDVIYESDGDYDEILKVLIRRARDYCSTKGVDWQIRDYETEGDELDPIHFINFRRLGGEFYLSPIGENPENILDTKAFDGTWAQHIANKFPDASVVASDISEITPFWQPSNLIFNLDDFGNGWEDSYGTDYFDFIRSRDFSKHARGWDDFLEATYKVLKPGGWYEHQEISIEVYSESGSRRSSVPEAIQEYAETTDAAYKKIGVNILSSDIIVGHLEEAGFVDVKQHIYKVPIGTWPKDPVEKEIGAFNLYNLLNTLETETIQIYQNLLQGTEEWTREVITKAESALKNRNNHLYKQLYVTVGRKPE